MQDPMFFNKIASAMLIALLLFFGLPQLAAAVRGGEHHGKAHGEEIAHPFPQYPIAYATDAAASNEAGRAVDFATLLATADPKAGERRAALCKSCHTFEKGGANGTGPNLWGVVGRAVASHAGFNYTGALKAAGGDWTIDRLDPFLANSQGYIQGTAMVQRFPKGEQRAELIAYLNTLSDNPAPLPAPTAAPAASGETPADTGAPAETLETPAEAAETAPAATPGEPAGGEIPAEAPQQAQ